MCYVLPLTSVLLCPSRLFCCSAALYFSCLCFLESSIIHAIHDLEEMEDVEIDDKIQLPKVRAVEGRK